MFRKTVCAFTITLLSIFLVHGKNSTGGQMGNNSALRLDGVYEFISESTILTKPGKAAYKRMSPEWAGTWQFQNGHYIRVLMKRRRDPFFESKKVADLGFESFAGPYEIDEESIRLTQSISLNPFEVDRTALMTFRLEGDMLILVEKLTPYMEDLREGTITTTLRRVK